MPELPEVERVRRTLDARLAGRTVRKVTIHRRNVVRGGRSVGALLRGERLERVDRRGKQLAVVGQSGRCLCVHLGMTGSLRWDEPGQAPVGASHVHLVWTFDDGSTLQFRDPRRFGGVWAFPSIQALHAQRWTQLGPDALRVTASELHRRLQRTRRPLKAALLDQRVVAGLGNIYVDELLFACHLPPTRLACTLSPGEIRRLVPRMRRLLERAIKAGGSTFRDYIDGTGAKGTFQQQHRVYGRGGEPCRRCRRPLSESQVAGRTTVFCTTCQTGVEQANPVSRTVAVD